MQATHCTTSSSTTGEQDELSAYEMLLQGIDQTIHIPLNKILFEVMQRMRAKKPPSFKYTKAGPSSCQVTVELNVTGSRFTVEPTVDVATLVGEISSTMDLAMISAVKKAFDYLENKHFVKVIDYSSEVAEGYDCNIALGQVNSVGYNLEKVLDDWMAMIEKIGMFHADLERYESYETTNGVVSAAGLVYAQTKDFVEPTFSNYHEKHRVMYLEFCGFEGKRAKHIRNASDQINNYRSKGYRQFIEFNAKDVLSCVLELLCLKPAEYSNKPVGCGEFYGEVLIHLPDIEEARCGGRTKFVSGMRSSAGKAEQHAAYKALRYMESNLKLVIIDMNYSERVEAEGDHEFMVKLFRSIVGLARRVQNEWSKMKEGIDDGVYIYGGNRLSASSPAENAALKFCKDGFEQLQVDCKIPYETMMDKLKNLDKYNLSDDEGDN